MDEQRALTTRSANRTLLGLSAPLASVLTSGESDAAERIADSPALLAEVRNSLPLARNKATRSATRDEIKAVMVSRMQVFPQPIRTDGEWAMWFLPYFDALDGLTAEAIDAGLKAYIAKPDSEFMPKPGQLRYLATTTPTPTIRALEMMSKAVDISVQREAEARAMVGRREAPNVRPRHMPKSREDRDFVSAGLADFLTAQKARIDARPRPEIRPTHGPVVEGRHITAEMVELLNRQTQENAAARERAAAHGAFD